jgi:hypothetical protein
VCLSQDRRRDLSGVRPAIHTLISDVSLRQNCLWISTKSSCTSVNDLSRERRPSPDEDRTVLGAVKALAALDPSGYGRDAASAQLEGRTYVMADATSTSFRR